MHDSPSGSEKSDRGESVPPGDKPGPPAKQSLWGMAKDAVSNAGAQASKAVATGGAAAAKTAEFGKLTIDAAAGATHGAIDAGKGAYADSKLESVVNFVDSELEHRGVKKAVKDTSGAVVGKLDQVTGKRLVELLEERLRMQDAYNDALATRLAEALERIERLEARHNEH